jgi:hypothetical protein
MPNWFFTSNLVQTLPDGRVWWPGSCISVEAPVCYDANEYVGAFTNDRYQQHYQHPNNVPLFTAIILPDDWKPGPAFLVCEKKEYYPVLIKRFRVRSSTSAALILAKCEMERLQKIQPEKKFYLADEKGLPIT